MASFARSSSPTVFGTSSPSSIADGVHMFYNCTSNKVAPSLAAVLQKESELELSRLLTAVASPEEECCEQAAYDIWTMLQKHGSFVISIPDSSQKTWSMRQWLPCRYCQF